MVPAFVGYARWFGRTGLPRTLYYIQSSEIQGNIVDINCIFYIFTSENIKSYIFTPQECTYNFFGLPLTFPLTHCSALQNFKRL